MSGATLTTATKLNRLRVSAIARLAENPVGRYSLTSPEASEPTAWSALALHAAGSTESAQRAADWLTNLQQRNGAVGVTAVDIDPAWTTGLAILAWGAIDQDAYAEPIRRGAEWALGQQPWTAEGMTAFAHDASIEGWSWAPNTHSWLEPTAFFVMALQRNGYSDHPRVRQGVDLLIDRLLPSGGVNYGNTIVLGQELLQHLQPTGIAAWALAAEQLEDPRWNETLSYLQRAAHEPTGIASLCYATIGLAANGHATDMLAPLLEAAGERAIESSSDYKIALFGLASGALLAETSGLFAEEVTQ